jgi:hypothetical protein
MELPEQDSVGDPSPFAFQSQEAQLDGRACVSEKSDPRCLTAVSLENRSTRLSGIYWAKERKSWAGELIPNPFAFFLVTRMM